MPGTGKAWIIAALCAVGLPAASAIAALPVPKAEISTRMMPPLADLRTAARAYPVTTLAVTNHAGWSDSSGYVNVPQTVRVTWHVNSGGKALLLGRDAWDPHAPWCDLGRWGRGSHQPPRGETELAIAAPTLLRLRVRAGRFPHSGIASLRVDYQQHTVALLRGPAGRVRRPVILAKGYDPFNEHDWNDPGWQEDPALARFIAEGRNRYDLDLWLLDWGDGGAPLEQQAEDFADIARQLKSWNGERRETVAVGVSMGAVAIRYALAAAASRREDLGVQKYISINGPHQGAWLNPDLLRLLKRAARRRSKKAAESAAAFLVERGLGNPAAQEMLISGERHDAFYADLRSRGVEGYDPTIPRVAFSNGTLVREGNELAELVRGKRDVLLRVLLRPLWLPFWLTISKTRREFRYDAYPGELLSPGLMQPVREHVRILGLFRFDIRARWESTPTFIPTHSALDFPEDLTGGPLRFSYSRWRETPFSRVYVAAGRNLAHEETSVDWINPRTGKSAPPGVNAVLDEIIQAFRTGR